MSLITPGSPLRRFVRLRLASRGGAAPGGWRSRGVSRAPRLVHPAGVAARNPGPRSFPCVAPPLDHARRRHTLGGAPSVPWFARWFSCTHPNFRVHVLHRGGAESGSLEMARALGQPPVATARPTAGPRALRPSRARRASPFWALASGARRRIARGQRHQELGFGGRGGAASARPGLAPADASGRSDWFPISRHPAAPLVRRRSGRRGPASRCNEFRGSARRSRAGPAGSARSGRTAGAPPARAQPILTNVPLSAPRTDRHNVTTEAPT
jgi:hypothetical protein